MHSFARVQSRMSHLRQLIKPGLVIAPVSRVSHNQVALRVDPPEGLLVRRPVREAADREQVMNMEAAVPLPATTTNRTRLPRPIVELLEFSDRPPDFLALAHTISFAVTHRSSPFSPPPWGGVWYYLPDPVHGCMVCSEFISVHLRSSPFIHGGGMVLPPRSCAWLHGVFGRFGRPPPTHIHLSTCLCCLCCLCCLLVTSVRPRSVNSINSPSPTANKSEQQRTRANKSEQAMYTISRVFSFGFTVYMAGGRPGRCVP